MPTEQEQVVQALLSVNGFTLAPDGALRACDHEHWFYVSHLLASGHTTSECAHCGTRRVEVEWLPQPGQVFYAQSRYFGTVMEAHACTVVDGNHVYGAAVNSPAWMAFAFRRSEWFFRTGQEVN